MKIIPQDQLKNYSLCTNVIDTHISKWKNGDYFERFKKIHRPFSGLFFILSDIEIVYVEQDRCGVPIRKVHCKKGDILYIPPNILYHALFACKSNARETDTFTINFDLYDSLGNHIQLDERIILLNNKVNPYMIEDLFNIHKCSRNPVICNKLRINSLFFSILYYATRGDNKTSSAIKAAVHAIENEYNRNEKMEKYSHMCNMSLTYFYQEFHSYTGMSPTKYRNHIRINVAKSDIHNTNMSMKEIALKVGFNDEFYFSRLFKAITGMTPKQFKQE